MCVTSEKERRCKKADGPGNDGRRPVRRGSLIPAETAKTDMSVMNNT
jgi:hypothetical protein